MAEFSSKEASAAVILLIYMSGKLQGLRDNEIFYRVPRAIRDQRSKQTFRACLEFLSMLRTWAENDRA